MINALNVGKALVVVSVWRFGVVVNFMLYSPHFEGEVGQANTESEFWNQKFHLLIVPKKAIIKINFLSRILFCHLDGLKCNQLMLVSGKPYPVALEVS